jgi:hypothetical protein
MPGSVGWPMCPTQTRTSGIRQNCNRKRKTNVKGVIYSAGQVAGQSTESAPGQVLDSGTAGGVNKPGPMVHAHDHPLHQKSH